MNYNEFLNNAKMELEEDLVTHPLPSCEPLRLDIREVNKVQGESYCGISFKKENAHIEGILDMREPFRHYLSGEPFEGILAETRQRLAEQLKAMPEVDPLILLNYQDMRSKLMTELIPQHGNEEMLSGVPYKAIEDLALIYRIDLGESSNGRMTVLVTNRMLKEFGVSAEQLHQDALDNGLLNNPGILKTMQEVMSGIMGMELEEPECDHPAMYVASNQNSFMGASVIFYPGYLEAAAKRINGDFFILPSSIHEVLLIPDDGNVDYLDLEAMVKSVNESQVMPADRLSDHVYHYDRNSVTFELAYKAALRKTA